MVSKREITQIYIDTSLLFEWFARLMRGESAQEPRIIKFLYEHKEISKFISIFTIAELVEKLLFHETGIKDYMRKPEVINSFAQSLMQTTGIKIIELEKEGENKGIFISPNIVKYAAICGSVKDAVHVCIAEHENLWLVTHDNKLGKIKPLYDKIITDTHLLKLYE